MSKRTKSITLRVDRSERQFLAALLRQPGAMEEYRCTLEAFDNGGGVASEPQSLVGFLVLFEAMKALHEKAGVEFADLYDEIP
jgi:hypothetical protein